MPNVKFSTAGNAVSARGLNLSEIDTFEIVEQPNSITTPVNVDTTIKDVVERTTSGTGIDNSFKINRKAGSLADNNGTYSSSNNAIATVDSTGRVLKGSSSGLVEITYQSTSSRFKVTRNMVSTGTSVKIISDWTANSLARHMDFNVKTLMTGKSPTDINLPQVMYIAANYSDGSASAIDNPNLFCRFGPNGSTDLNFEAVSLASSNGYAYPYVLISPNHILGCNHAGRADAPIHFAKNGVTYTANRTQYRQVGGDMAIYHIFPSITDISPIRMLPVDWQLYLPTMNTETTPLAISTLIRTANSGQVLPFTPKQGGGGDTAIITQNSPKIRLGQLKSLKSQFGQNNKFFINELSSNPTVRSWQSNLYDGDSGSPQFTIINNELCLIGVMWYGGGGRGDFVSNYLTEIQAAMNSISTAAGTTQRTLGTFSAGDLSAFTQFP